MLLAKWSLLLSFVLVAACTGGAKGYADRYEGDWADPPEDPHLAEIQSLEDQLSEAGSQIERVEEELFELKQASESLQTEIDRFDEEDWRDVVPDVVWANDELKSEIEDTEGELSKLSSNL